ncbi:MAG: hypothetical protein RL220_668 [Bacteroidota bacterium]|jgi:hypothetical protein
MKKQLLLAFCALGLFAGTASAQMTFGAKAGLNYSIVTTNFKEGEKPDDWENASGIGFHIGGFMNYDINDNLHFRPELLYSSRGTSSSSTTEIDILGVVTKVETDEKSSTNYLEIPLLLALGANDGFQLHVGPSVNLLMGGKATLDNKTTVGGVTTEESVEVSGSDFTDGMSGLDLGLVVGAGMTTDSGLGFGLRYQRGLTSINSENTDQVVSNWNVVQASVSYSFGN